MKKKSFVFLVVLLISMLIFNSMAFASEKVSNVSNDPIKVLSIESVPYDELPANVKSDVDKQQKEFDKQQKESKGIVTPKANYFASASISCDNPVSEGDITNIYVTTLSYPGGLWVFEAVDFANNWGVIPLSPVWQTSNSQGTRWSWGSLPGQSKTVKIRCSFANSGDYKLHVWGGFGLLSHADAVKIITAQ